jgi:signal transduction histidine kinase
MGLRERASRPLSSVRVRVTLVATLMATLVATIGSLVFVSELRSALERNLLASSEQQVSAVQARLRANESEAQAVTTGKNDLVVQIIAPHHRIVATDHPRVLAPLRTTPGEDRHVRVPGLDDQYVVVARRERGGPNIIVAGRSNEQVAKATVTAGVLLGIGVPLGLVLLACAVWLAVGRALRPVEAMRGEAATITAEHLNRRLAVPAGEDEIPRLARTLNEMLDRIDASNRQQRQFVSDASHELRSPLTTLRQLAEVARDYPDRTRQDLLAQDVLAEESRMEDLVAALLLLARVDDEPPPVNAAVDLDDLVLAEVRRVRATGGPRIDVSGVSAGQVVGDRVLLGQVVANLLSNAMRHARCEVSVSLQEYDDQVVLAVDDDGAGIAEADRDRVFDRFVRLDEARARDAGGSGLGLAIVHKVVHGLGGAVRVQSSLLGGARFVVTLPSA